MLINHNIYDLFLRIQLYIVVVFILHIGGLPLARFTVYNKITSPEKLALVNKDNKDLGNEWLDYLASVDRAQSTIKGYRNDLDIFWCWNLEHNKNKDFAKLTKRDIAKFQNHAINVWGWSPKRTRRVKSCLSSLSDYIENMLDEEEEFEGFRKIVNKIENPANEAVREKTILPDEKVDDLLKTLVKQEKYEKACAIAIAAYSGMRKSEIIQMKMSYFTEDALEFDGALYKTPKIRTKGRGKLGKQLNKFILVDVKKYIDLWDKQRKELGVDIDDIFVTKDKNGWHRRSNLDKWTAEFSEMLDVDFYYHCMRHYTCTAFAKKNIPIDVIKEFFGWSSTELVGIYNDSSAEDDFGKYFTKNGIKEGKQGSLSDL
jgi:integrase